MKLALFDFDGTISDKDSFLLFMKKASLVRFYFACSRYFPQILLYLGKKYPDYKLKEAFLTTLFKGRQFESLKEFGHGFADDILPSIIRPGAQKAIDEYLSAGDRVVVVTASPRIFLEPWCKKQGIEILGTELDVDRFGKVTGKIDGLNCHGQEKVRRIKSVYSLDEYEQIDAYGDTSGDLPMLSLASPERSFYKPFR